MTAWAENVIEAKWFQKGIIWLILVNAVILGLETDQDIMAAVGPVLLTIDKVILGIFILEIALKLIARKLAFFKNPWNLFDVAVVGIALFPASGPFAALRALRVLRVLRLISAVPSMRKVIEGLLSAIPGIMSVALLMCLIFYVFSVIATHLFASSFPDWFGSLGATMFTLFQLMTLESWAMGIVRPVMEIYPWAWSFFVVYLLVTTFTMLNLFIAIIIDAMHGDVDEQAEQSRHDMREGLSDDMKAMESRLMAEIKSLKAELGQK